MLFLLVESGFLWKPSAAAGWSARWRFARRAVGSLRFPPHTPPSLFCGNATLADLNWPPFPNGHYTNTYFFKGGFAVRVWLWCQNRPRRSRYTVPWPSGFSIHPYRQSLIQLSYDTMDTFEQTEIAAPILWLPLCTNKGFFHDKPVGKDLLRWFQMSGKVLLRLVWFNELKYHFVINLSIIFSTVSYNL